MNFYDYLQVSNFFDSTCPVWRGTWQRRGSRIYKSISLGNAIATFTYIELLGMSIALLRCALLTRKPFITQFADWQGNSMNRYQSFTLQKYKTIIAIWGKRREATHSRFLVLHKIETCMFVKINYINKILWVQRINRK